MLPALWWPGPCPGSVPEGLRTAVLGLASPLPCVRGVPLSLYGCLVPRPPLPPWWVDVRSCYPALRWPQHDLLGLSSHLSILLTVGHSAHALDPVPLPTPAGPPCPLARKHLLSPSLAAWCLSL